MKILDGIKLKGRGVEIPDCSRDDLPEFFVEMGFRVGAEIGVYKGEFSEKLCKAGLKIYGIDPWAVYDEYDLNPQARQDFLYGHAQRILAAYPDCTLIRKTSMEAVKDFEDESLDFVYIDGHHGFKYVSEDIWEWSKKVKKGGIISGHDYGDYLAPATSDPNITHVRHVVDAYAAALKIKNWYVLGCRNKKIRGEKRDKWRSWMWIKT